MADFKTLKQLSTGEYKDRGSKFIAYARVCYEEKDAKTLLDELKKEHHKARHVCYAYKIGLEYPLIRTHDDGEPSNTGGQPILNHINKFELDNVIVAVVRYFGGVLLGKGGLIKAYGGAAENAIVNAKIITLQEKIIIRIIMPFTDYALLLDALKQFNAEIIAEDFDETCHLQLRIDKDSFKQIEKKIRKFKVDAIELIS